MTEPCYNNHAGTILKDQAGLGDEMQPPSHTGAGGSRWWLRYSMQEMSHCAGTTAFCRFLHASFEKRGKTRQWFSRARQTDLYRTQHLEGYDLSRWGPVWMHVPKESNVSPLQQSAWCPLWNCQHQWHQVAALQNSTKNGGYFNHECRKKLARNTQNIIAKNNSIQSKQPSLTNQRKLQSLIASLEGITEEGSWSYLFLKQAKRISRGSLYLRANRDRQMHVILREPWDHCHPKCQQITGSLHEALPTTKKTGPIERSHEENMILNNVLSPYIIGYPHYFMSYLTFSLITTFLHIIMRTL